MSISKIIDAMRANKESVDETLRQYRLAVHRKKVGSKPRTYISDKSHDDSSEQAIIMEATPKAENSRISKTIYYLNIAKAVAMRSTCIRRQYGAIIVKDDRIVATGYNGSPRGRVNCCDTGSCIRAEQNIPHGERYELCRSVHAEQNAIIAAGYASTNGATLYLAGIDKDTGALIDTPDCCMMCKRVVINAGIDNVIFLNGDGSTREVKVSSWVESED